MTTITIKNGENISRTNFDTLGDFQLYLLQLQQESGPSEAHIKVLEARLLDAKNNPGNSISYHELKSSITREI
ncbi:MAG: hypothetical protein DRJ10_11880 [Bacteroidetes bacterium]|nr:MAG: hypothetical protein DRJ10_11880 [Bacteroidota bacterium]